MKKIGSITVLLCILVFFFSACSKTEHLSWYIQETDAGAIAQGAGGAREFSMTGNGGLHIKNGKLLFFDCSTEKDFVLCSKADCSHHDESCSGWFGENEEVAGLAEYEGKIYFFMHQSEQNMIQLIRMDSDGGAREVVAQLSQGETWQGKWNASLGEVYYAGGKAITTLDWNYIPEVPQEEDKCIVQCLGVDLQTGEITEFMSLEEESRCFIESVCETYAVIGIEKYQNRPMKANEFEKEYELGTFEENEDVMHSENPYDAYKQWYFNETPLQYEFLLYDLNGKSISILSEGTLKQIEVEDGTTYSRSAPFHTIGWYEGNLLIEENEETYFEDEGIYGIKNTRIYSLDVKANQKELLLNIDDGYLLDAGNLDIAQVGDGDKLFFMKRKTNGKADYCIFSLKSREEKMMYEGDTDVPYIMMGETKSAFIYFTQGDIINKKMYIIDKEDYYNGNFNASDRLRAMDEWLFMK